MILAVVAANVAALLPAQAEAQKVVFVCRSSDWWLIEDLEERKQEHCLSRNPLSVSSLNLHLQRCAAASGNLCSANESPSPPCLSPFSSGALGSVERCQMFALLFSFFFELFSTSFFPARPPNWFPFTEPLDETAVETKSDENVQSGGKQGGEAAHLLWGNRWRAALSGPLRCSCHRASFSAAHGNCRRSKQTLLSCLLASLRSLGEDLMPCDTWLLKWWVPSIAVARPAALKYLRRFIDH